MTGTHLLFDIFPESRTDDEILYKYIEKNGACVETLKLGNGQEVSVVVDIKRRH